jgi:hypothetical protein
MNFKSVGRRFQALGAATENALSELDSRPRNDIIPTTVYSETSALQTALNTRSLRCWLRVILPGVSLQGRPCHILGFNELSTLASEWNTGIQTQPKAKRHTDCLIIKSQTAIRNWQST